MLKALNKMTTYSGNFTEDLEEVIQTFETLSDVCDVNIDSKRRKEIPIMLKGTELWKYSSNKYLYSTFQESVDALRSCFSSTEKKPRLLSEWNTMRLTEALAQRPDKTEIEVFK